MLDQGLEDGLERVQRRVHLEAVRLAVLVGRRRGEDERARVVQLDEVGERVERRRGGRGGREAGGELRDEGERGGGGGRGLLAGRRRGALGGALGGQRLDCHARCAGRSSWGSRWTSWRRCRCSTELSSSRADESRPPLALSCLVCLIDRGSASCIAPRGATGPAGRELKSPTIALTSSASGSTRRLEQLLPGSTARCSSATVPSRSPLSSRRRRRPAAPLHRPRFSRGRRRARPRRRPTPVRRPGCRARTQRPCGPARARRAAARAAGRGASERRRLALVRPLRSPLSLLARPGPLPVSPRTPHSHLLYLGTLSILVLVTWSQFVETRGLSLEEMPALFGESGASMGEADKRGRRRARGTTRSSARRRRCASRMSGGGSERRRSVPGPRLSRSSCCSSSLVSSTVHLIIKAASSMSCHSKRAPLVQRPESSSARHELDQGRASARASQGALPWLSCSRSASCASLAPTMRHGERRRARAQSHSGSSSREADGSRGRPARTTMTRPLVMTTALLSVSTALSYSLNSYALTGAPPRPSAAVAARSPSSSRSRPRRSLRCWSDARRASRASSSDCGMAVEGLVEADGRAAEAVRLSSCEGGREGGGGRRRVGGAGAREAKSQLVRHRGRQEEHIERDPATHLCPQLALPRLEPLEPHLCAPNELADLRAHLVGERALRAPHVGLGHEVVVLRAREEDRVGQHGERGRSKERERERARGDAPAGCGRPGSGDAGRSSPGRAPPRRRAPARSLGTTLISSRDPGLRSCKGRGGAGRTLTQLACRACEHCSSADQCEADGGAGYMLWRARDMVERAGGEVEVERGGGGSRGAGARCAGWMGGGACREVVEGPVVGPAGRGGGVWTRARSLSRRPPCRRRVQPLATRLCSICDSRSALLAARSKRALSPLHRSEVERLPFLGSGGRRSLSLWTGSTSCRRRLSTDQPSRRRPTLKTSEHRTRRASLPLSLSRLERAEPGEKGACACTVYDSSLDRRLVDLLRALPPALCLRAGGKKRESAVCAPSRTSQSRRRGEQRRGRRTHRACRVFPGRLARAAVARDGARLALDALGHLERARLAERAGGCGCGCGCGCGGRELNGGRSAAEGDEGRGARGGRGAQEVVAGRGGRAEGAEERGR